MDILLIVLIVILVIGYAFYSRYKENKYIKSEEEEEEKTSRDETACYPRLKGEKTGKSRFDEVLDEVRRPGKKIIRDPKKNQLIQVRRRHFPNDPHFQPPQSVSF